MKFRKAYNLMVVLVIAAGFLSQGITFSDEAGLRPPSHFNKATEEFIEEGKSPEDMVRILSNSEYRDKPFTVKQYRELWISVYQSELSDSTARSDLRGAITAG